MTYRLTHWLTLQSYIKKQPGQHRVCWNCAGTYTVFFHISEVCTRGVSLTNLFRSYLSMLICLFTFSCWIVLEKEIINTYIYTELEFIYIWIYYLVKVLWNEWKFQGRRLMQDTLVNIFALIGKEKIICIFYGPEYLQCYVFCIYFTLLW